MKNTLEDNYPTHFKVHGETKSAGYITRSLVTTISSLRHLIINSNAGAARLNLSQQDLEMTPEQLATNIARHYPTKRAFIEDFNRRTEVGLDETTLSRQLSGRIGLGMGWKAAYTLFFEYILQP